jgi:hypothetical protein
MTRLIFFIISGMLFLVVGGVAGAQIKEMKLSGCVSKNSRTVDRIYNQNVGEARIFIANKASNTIVEIVNFDSNIRSYTYKLKNINSGYAEGIIDYEIRRDVKDQPYLHEWTTVKLFYDNKEAKLEFNYKDLKLGTTKTNDYEYVCNSKKSN